MTGATLYQVLFEGKHNELTNFSKHIGKHKQNVRASIINAENVSVALLKQYASWQKIDEGEFIKFATGPAPDSIMEQPPKKSVDTPIAGSDGLLREYEHNYTQPKKQPPKKEGEMPTGDMLQVVRLMVESQREQNAAMLKLANAAEINAKTIAKLNGIAS